MEKYFWNTEIGLYTGDKRDPADIELGERPSANHIVKNGKWVLDVVRMKADKVTELSTDCQAQIYAGFDSAALGASYHYPAKDKDQTNLSGSVVASLLPNLATDWTTPFWCLDAAGNWAFMDHTAAQIQQVGVDAKAAILDALAKNKSLVDQVMAIADDDPDADAKIAAIAW